MSSISTEFIVESKLVQVIQRYPDRGICLLTSPAWSESRGEATLRAGRVMQGFKEKGIHFLRVVARGRTVDRENPDPDVQVMGLMAFDVGEGGRAVPAFVEVVRGIAQVNGVDLLLYKLSGNLAKLLVVRTGQRLAVYRAWETGIVEYLSLAARNDCYFLSLERQQYAGSGWMASLHAKIIGEIF